MSEVKRQRSAAGGAFIHEPPDSPTPEPGSLGDRLRRAFGLSQDRQPDDPKVSHGLTKQLRFLLEMLRAGLHRGPGRNP